MATIRYLVAKLLGNPVATSVVNSLILDLKEEGTEMLSIVVANIKAAAARDDIDNTARYNMVLNAVKEQFPNTATSLINTVIESTYRAYAQGRL